MRPGLGLFHPSRARLREWLDTGGPAGVADHVERCDTCAARLDEIDAAEPATADADAPTSIRSALADLIAPPTDLVEQVLRGVDDRRRAERELALIAGLFSIGIETAQLLLDPGTEHDSRDDRGTTPNDDPRTVDDQEDTDRE